MILIKIKTLDIVLYICYIVKIYIYIDGSKKKKLLFQQNYPGGVT